MELPSAVAAAKSGLSVEEGARAEQEAPLRGCRALPAVRAGRAQAGPRAPRPPLPRSVPAPRRRRSRRSRPFWALRFAFAINTQEMHNLTCEVEPFPSVVTGPAGWWRLLERGGGARRPQTGRAQGEVGFPETGFIYSPSPEPGGSRQGEERRSSCPHSLRDDQGQPQCHLGIPHKPERPSHLCLRL